MTEYRSPRAQYDAELRELEHGIVDMAAHAERMVGDAVAALGSLDRAAAKAVIRADDDVDRLDMEIETRCIRLLALQQPTATDLRVVGSALKIITDIERIADLAVDIAKIARKVEGEGGSADVIDLPKMASVARTMVREAIGAYVHRDAARIARVAELETEVDAQYRVLRGQLFRHMQEGDAQLVTDGWLLLAIHHVERIADHALNIAERVSFIMTGELRQLASPDKPLP